MDIVQRARALRADGMTFAGISRELGIGLQWAYKCAGDIQRAPQETAKTIVRHFPHNGGCSTLSGVMPISLPRIAAIHGAAA